MTAIVLKVIMGELSGVAWIQARYLNCQNGTLAYTSKQIEDYRRLTIMVQKSLDEKLARILMDRSAREFILADAKDADMAYGLAAPGKSPEHHAHEGRFRTLDEYRQIIREIVAQGLVDIVLMSASSNEVLTIRERVFDKSRVTPAVRANDTTDIWLAGSGLGVYDREPSRPFRSATIDHIMCGKAECQPEERKLGADLGLYSVTFNNNVELDLRTLEAYREFRLEAEKKSFRHFLEVFSPNAAGENTPRDIARFVNDHIVRTLAGVTSCGRPLFLKIPYYGPEAMEALVRYDSSLVVGILGGSAGTTYDAFFMLWDAKQHGARVALYGRKINNAEDQLTFIKYLRLVADEQIEPVEAVKAYHNDLHKLGITPYRSLEEDLQLTQTSLSYSGADKPKQSRSAEAKAMPRVTMSTWRTPPDEPDFSRMTPAEKAQYNIERWKRIIG